MKCTPKALTIRWLAKSRSSAQPVLRTRAGRHRGGNQALGSCVQLEGPVESVGNGAEVACGLLAGVEGAVGPGETGLDVAQDGVDPVKVGQGRGIAGANPLGLVVAAGVADPVEAGQAVGDDAAGSQVGAGSGRDRRAREPRHGGQFGMDRVAVGIHRHRGQEWHLVLRAAPDRAAAELAAEVRNGSKQRERSWNGPGSLLGICQDGLDTLFLNLH